MDIGVISTRYARALLKSATDAKLEEQVYQEMMTLAKSFTEVPALRQTIDNPMLDKSKKQTLLETAAGGTLSKLTQTFIALVLKEDRENMVQFMADVVYLVNVSDLVEGRQRVLKLVELAVYRAYGIRRKACFQPSPDIA